MHGKRISFLAKPSNIDTKRPINFSQEKWKGNQSFSQDNYSWNIHIKLTYFSKGIRLPENYGYKEKAIYMVTTRQCLLRKSNMDAS